MKALLVVVFALAAIPVEAHCYSHWYYPRPQDCRSTLVRLHRTWIAEAPPAPVAAAPDIDPILIPPGWDEEQERAEALRQAERKLEEEKRNGD
jgi:hypothetical protein